MRYTIDLNILADSQDEAEKIAIEHGATWFDVPRACISATTTGARTSPHPGKMYATVAVEEFHHLDRTGFCLHCRKGRGGLRT